MYNLTLVSLATAFILQNEMQIFINNLFNGFESRTLVVMHTNDTEYLVDSIAPTAVKHHQQLLLINLDLESYRFRTINGIYPFEPEVVLLLMLGAWLDQRISDWMNEYRYLHSQTRMIWLIENRNLITVRRFVFGLRDIRSMYNVVVLNFNEKSQELLAYKAPIFDTKESMINPRDVRFRFFRLHFYSGCL